MNDNKITQLQLISVGACYLMGTILQSVFISIVLTNESWIAAFSGAVMFIPVMLIYVSIAKKYPGKSLFEINEIVFGSIAGRVLSFFYLLFFISVCTLNVRGADNFISGFLLDGSPIFVIVLSFMAACVYCVKKGIVAIARISTVFAIFCVSALILNFALSFSNANPAFLLPILNKPFLKYVQATHIAVSIPYGESIFLLAIIPKVSSKVSIRKTYFFITAFTIFIILLISIREIMTIGPLLGFFSLPSYEATRLMSIYHLLARIESIYSLLLTSLTFFKATVTFYVCCTAIVQIFRLESYRHIAIMLAVFVGAYSLRVFPQSANTIYWGTNIAPFIWSFFTVILPFFTFVAALIRSITGKHGKRLQSQQEGVAAI